MHSYEIQKGLHLVHAAVETKVKATPTRTPVNHIAVIDCSGSMSYDLPRIRDQLKRRLPMLLGPDDTISLVWFSGRGQYGTLIEAEPVATLTDLQAVNAAIDRWLRPVSLTGFKEPLEEVSRLVDRVKGKHGAAFALFFMSDGCDNQWSRPEILGVVEKASGKLSSATFVEYGYYADRQLMAKMAERAGGTHIFAEGFDRYSPQFEAAMQRKVTGGVKRTVQLPGEPIGGFAFAIYDGDLLTFGSDVEGKVQVPEGVKDVWFLYPSKQGRDEGVLKEGSVLYAALSLFSTRAMPEVVLPLLKATGDVALIERFGTLFGKQAYTEFMQASKAAVFDTKLRLTKGYDPARVPPDDAFTVLDLLQLLAADEHARVLLDHPAFVYNRIGRARVDANEMLSDDEQAELARLTAELGKTKQASRVAEINAQIAALTAGKSPLRFVAKAAPDGYPISSLTYNEKRANVSILVCKSGTVDLTEKLPAQFKGVVPAVFDTFVWRNYALVKDGLLNVEQLPVYVSLRMCEELEAKMPGRVDPRGQHNSDGGGLAVVLDLRGLPIINRQMVSRLTARELVVQQYELMRLRAAQKVLGAIHDEKYPPRKSEGFVAFYGEEAAAWLKEQGLTDYSGFSPKSVAGEARDFYMAKEVTVNIKGLSALPSVKEAREKLAAASKPKGKPPTLAVQLMAPYLTNGAPDDQAELEKRQRGLKTQIQAMLLAQSRARFAIIVGQAWPFESVEQDTIELEHLGHKLVGTVKAREVEVSL